MKTILLLLLQNLSNSTYVRPINKTVLSVKITDLYKLIEKPIRFKRSMFES